MPADLVRHLLASEGSLRQPRAFRATGVFHELSPDGWMRLDQHGKVPNMETMPSLVLTATIPIKSTSRLMRLLRERFGKKPPEYFVALDGMPIGGHGKDRDIRLVFFHHDENALKAADDAWHRKPGARSEDLN